MKLTAENVFNTLEKMLWKPEDVHGLDDDALCAKSVVVDGLMGPFAFNPASIPEAVDDVASMLSQLHDSFSEGGGGSFLNLCERKDGVLWGEHPSCNELCVIAIACGLGKWTLRRERWSMLPGGMPYFTVIKRLEQVT